MVTKIENFKNSKSHPNYSSISTQEEDIETPASDVTVYSNSSATVITYPFFVIAGFIILATVISVLYRAGFSAQGEGDLLLALERNIPFERVEHPDNPTPLWGAVMKPFPTGAFWTNFVVKRGDGVVGVLPYGVKVLENGIQVSYGATRRVVNQFAVVDPFFSDMEITSKESYVKRYVERWDNISVTMKYETSENGIFKSPLVKGSPFITVEYLNATPVIKADVMKIISVDSFISTTDTQGSQYIVTLGNWQKWLVYCSGDIPLEKREDSLVLPKKFTGIIRLSILPLQNFKEAAEALLLYVKKYPISGSVLFSYPVPNTADLAFHFATKGSGPLLTLCLPHHVDLMKSPDLENADHVKLHSILSRYYSVKGKMTPVIGDSWTIRYNLVQVGWKYVPFDQIKMSQMDIIAENLLADVQEIIPSAADPYGFGKQLGRMAQLALIADELGIPDARQIALSNLKNALTPWLLGQNQNPLRYDKTWGGIVPADGLEHFNNDFGAGWYSDHHFQYGYFAYAIAALTKLDPLYWKAYRSSMDAIIRDICNPYSEDPDFPFVRHKDLFDGHSWASGLFFQGNGKGQESSSESVNAYYGVYLYGLASANNDFTKFSQTLLTMEVHSTKTYWHMSPHRDPKKPPVYDAVFAANLMVGNIGAIDATASTWFGSKLEFVHGINMMPLTPVTALLFDQTYVKEQWPILGSRLEFKKHVPNFKQECDAHPECLALGITGMCCPTSDSTMLACCNGTQNVGIVQNEWLAYIYADHAVINREAAWDQVLSLQNFGAGGSKANSLYWTASRPPPLENFTYTFHEPKFSKYVPTSCAANSACDIAGMYGECCPTAGPKGIYLGCCPTVAH